MKYIVTCLLAACLSISALPAQTTTITDTAKTTQTEVVVQVKTPGKTETTAKPLATHQYTMAEYCLVASPMLVLLGMLLLTAILNMAGLPLTAFLKEPGDEPGAGGSAAMVPSFSRLVALFALMGMLCVAACAGSFWIYNALRLNTAPDYAPLIKIILALGAGLIPFAIGQFANVFTGQRDF